MTPTLGPCFLVRPTRAGRQPLQGKIVAIKDGGLVDVSASGVIFSDVEFLAGSAPDGHNSTYAYQEVEEAKPVEDAKVEESEDDPGHKPKPPKPPIPPAKK